MARRYRQAVDLYTTGEVVELLDGSPVWIQPLNPFEQDTARNDAQIARARLTLALRDHMADEQAKVRMYFFEDGRDRAIEKITDARLAEAMPKMLDSIRNDPEWTERLGILDRGVDDAARPPEPGELKLLEEIARDFALELNGKAESERQFLAVKHDVLNDEELWTEYLDWYVERRAGEITLAEYRLHQMFFGTRLCDGAKSEADASGWEHSACNHGERFFLHKEEVRSAPQDLQVLLLEAYDELDMTVREAKNSRRQGSSSDSSPLPSEVEGSTASTQAVTPHEPLGSSSSRSATLSPSSVGVS